MIFSDFSDFFFPIAGNKKKIIIIMRKKKTISGVERIGLLPNYIVRKKNLYCNIKIVLQAIGERVVKLYYNTTFVLWLEWLQEAKLYHNTLHCIVAERLAVGRILS